MKKYVTGFVAGLLIGSMTVGTFAATGSQSIKATYKNIKVAVNNKVVALKDANGRTVEPFVYNGTTYLPVRGVATALGQQVSWDSKSNTVYVGEQPKNTNNSTQANSILLDRNGIRITYLGYVRQNSNYEEWLVSAEDSSIGNTEVSFGLLRSVSPGKIAYESVNLYDDTLRDDYHINNYGSVSFKIDAFPTTTYNGFTTGEITITK